MFSKKKKTKETGLKTLTRTQANSATIIIEEHALCKPEWTINKIVSLGLAFSISFGLDPSFLDLSSS